MDNEKSYVIKKNLNNNALVVLDDHHREVILIGKGIGFQRLKGDTIKHDASIEKMFMLVAESQREQMLRLVAETDAEVIRVITEYVKYAEKKLDRTFTNEFYVTLIDHLSFAIKRLQQGIKIHNPFLYDMRILYPAEYALAQEGTALLEQRLKMSIPEDETGFLALHLYSGRTDQTLSRMNCFSGLIAKLIKVTEAELDIEIDKQSIEYARLLTHLRFAIERAEKCRSPVAEKENPLSRILQAEYPLCYNVAWKLVRMLQHELKVDIPQAEVGYLALHIYRIVDRANN